MPATLIDTSAGRITVVSTFYRVCDLLGVGRYAEVYRAFDTSTSTDAALKIYTSADHAAHERSAAEYERLQVLARLNSEFFPRPRRLLKHRVRNQTHPVVVMELGQYASPDGVSKAPSLREVIPAYGATVTEAHPDIWTVEAMSMWLTELARAVALLHSQDIVHRDLKPANVLLKRRAGANHPSPLVLDFNGVARSDDAGGLSGTRLYLPPEVVAGQRSSPHADDDLWALARTLWEALYGVGAPVDDSVLPHHACPAQVAAALTPALRRGLSLKRDLRFPDAETMSNAVEQALRSRPGSQSPPAGAVTTEEWVAVRQDMERLRNLIATAVSPSDSLRLPKDIQEQVGRLLAWVSDADTQSFDLVADLVRFGPSAIPAILQEAHRVEPGTDVFRDATSALTKLADKDNAGTDTALAFYAASSHLSTRALCRAVCRAMKRLPVALTDLLMRDEGILLPHERLELADLCLQFGSDDATGILALTKYMCREYVISEGDSTTYRRLRTRIAIPLGKSAFEKKARVVAEDTGARIWEELPEYGSLEATTRTKVDEGLVQLLADAFGQMGDEALSVLRGGRVPPRVLDGASQVKAWRAFARKLAKQHPATREWLAAQGEDPDVIYALGSSHPRPPIGDQPSSDQDVALQARVTAYVQYGERRDFDALRFERDQHARRLIFDQLRRLMASARSHAEHRRVVELLRGYDGRSRADVVRYLLEYWPQLRSAHPAYALDALDGHRIADAHLRNQAIETLQSEMGAKDAARVRKALNRLLET